VGQVASLGEPTLVSLLGQAQGRQLHALAHNRDPRRVRVGRRRGSIGSQRALGRRHRTDAELDAALLGLVDRVTRRMRRAHRVGRTVVLRIRFDDFARITRSRTLPESTAQTETVLAAARDLLEGVGGLVAERGITLIGIAVANLDDDDAVQLTLPFDERFGQAIDAAVDGVRDRFGSTALGRASLMGRDPDLTVPMLPD
jgi:DNA polymerase-4